MRMQVGSLASLTGLMIPVSASYNLGCRCNSDPVLPWLWHRLAALIWPLAWELPYVAGVALKRPKKKRKKKTDLGRNNWDAVLVFWFLPCLHFKAKSKFFFSVNCGLYSQFIFLQDCHFHFNFKYCYFWREWPCLKHAEVSRPGMEPAP